MLQGWASDISSQIRGKQIVQYGKAKPESGRLASLFTYLPKEKKQPAFTVFEPMTSIMPHIFSRDPDDEFDPDAKIYLPDWGLEYIARRFNRVYEDDLLAYEEYVPGYPWPWLSTAWKTSKLEGK